MYYGHDCVLVKLSFIKTVDWIWCAFHRLLIPAVTDFVIDHLVN
jgi:hypothetical protein